MLIVDLTVMTVLCRSREDDGCADGEQCE